MNPFYALIICASPIWCGDFEVKHWHLRRDACIERATTMRAADPSIRTVCAAQARGGEIIDSAGRMTRGSASFEGNRMDMLGVPPRP